MRRGLLVLALCMMPMGAMAQTWSLPQDTYIVGNTLVHGAPMMLMAGGKASPSPSRGTAPSPATSPTTSSGRGESGFTFQQPLRVQLEGPTVTPPLYTPPPAPEAVPLTVQSEGHATLTIPVQVLWQRAVQSQPGLRFHRGGPDACPAGCVSEPVPAPRQHLCNAYGQ